MRSMLTLTIVTHTVQREQPPSIDLMSPPASTSSQTHIIDVRSSDLKRRDSNKPDQEPSKDNLTGKVKVPESLAKEAAKGSSSKKKKGCFPKK